MRDGITGSKWASCPLRDCSLELQTAELSRNGHKVILQDQPFLILTALLEDPGQLVTREELIKRLWPSGTFVDFEQSLNKAVARLREALGDNAEEPHFVETLPRKGYRWIGKVDRIETEVESAELDAGISSKSSGVDHSALNGFLRKGRLALSVSVLAVGVVLFAVKYHRTLQSHMANAASIRSLAVLPLENLSGDANQDYFSEGMTDELITNLAMLPELRVISRTSVMRYAGTRKSVSEIARELHVDGIVEGSVSRSEDRVRVRVQLIYAPLDQHLWAGAYERTEKDVILLQTAAARDIAEELRLELTKAEISRLSRYRTVNPESHEAYLMGRFYWNKRTPNDITTGLNYFEKAVSLDPNDPSGYAGIADSYIALGGNEFLSPREAFEKAREAALKALALDEGVAEAHSALAQVYQGEHDWAATEKEHKRALALNPNFAMAHLRYSFFLSKVGRHEEAIAEARQGRELDPLVSFGTVVLGQALGSARRYDQAVEVLKRAVDQDPNPYTASGALALVYAQKGIFRESIAILERVPHDSSRDVMISAPLGYAYAKVGRTHDAELILRELKTKSGTRYVSGYYAAWICVGLGRNEEALQWLESANRQQDYQLTWLGVDPIFDPLHSDQRFIAIIRQLGLPG